MEKDDRNAKDRKEQKAVKKSKKRKKTVPKEGRGTGPKAVLHAASGVDFGNVAAAQEFGSQFKEDIDRLSKKTDDQFLHILAKKNDWPDGMEWTPQHVKQFLDWALGSQGGHHNILECKNKDNYTPLHLALIEGHTAFVDAILDNPRLATLNLGSVLPETCQWGNSLHVAIKYKLEMRPMESLINNSKRFTKMFTTGDPQHSNTPLHMCMMDMEDYKQDGSDDEAESEEDSDGFDEDDHSSTSSHTEDSDRDHTRQDWVAVTTEPHVPSTLVDPRSPVGASRRLSHVIAPLVKQKSFLAPKASISTSRSHDIVKLLIQSQATILTQTNKNKRTPYQERMHQLEKHHSAALQKATDSANDIFKMQIEKVGTGLDKLTTEKLTVDGGIAARENLLQQIVADDPIASYIRSYCVRNFSRDRIMECLYHSGQERHLEFDLGGLPHPNISKEYLDSLSEHLRFESILKYVALPRLTMEPEPKERRKKGRGGHLPTKRGLSDVVGVFRWLRENGVKKIVKVMVIDDGHPSHADSSIEEALHDFGIEKWDWKRLDLDTDVISNSTKVAEEISLYSSGNNAVLKGWASPQGLPNKEKFPKLKRVNLFIREGLEDAARLRTYIDEFKANIKVETNSTVAVHETLDNKDVSYASEFKTEGLSQSENSWIDCVRAFVKPLRRVHAPNIRPVKVAIIDDGVDASLISLGGKIAIGKSFCYYANSTDQMSPYYIPSGNHGTCMADLICKLCPKVSLYIARLDERQAAGSGQRQITAKSAAEAIRWATECDVDIISMSWTIETPVEGNEDMTLFRNAVDQAAAKKILMFCSTSDQGSSTKDKCYPGAFGSCIKIGGATDTGEALSWVNAEKVDFLLPGKDLPFANNEGKIITRESGSSIATAAASGLAGLLIFCNWLVDTENQHFQDPKNMEGAFRALAGGSTNKFPHVQVQFLDRFKRELAKLQERQEREREGESEERDERKAPLSLPQRVTRINLENLVWQDDCTEALQTLLEYVVESS